MVGLRSRHRSVVYVVPLSGEIDPARRRGLFQKGVDLLHDSVILISIAGGFEHQKRIVRAAEVFVQDAVRHPDGMVATEPPDRVVVDLDPGNADSADHQQDERRDRSGLRTRHGFRPETRQAARQQMTFMRFLGLQLRYRYGIQPPDIGGNECDGQKERQCNPDGDEDSEHANRRNGR